jgi:hypothetical protein
MIKAIQEQQSMIEELKEIVATYEKSQNEMLPGSDVSSSPIPYIISFYPNPTSKELMVKVSVNSQNAVLTLYNKEGTPVKTYNNVGNNQAMSVVDLEDGVYVLALSVDSVTYDVKRIIVKK